VAKKVHASHLPDFTVARRRESDAAALMVELLFSVGSGDTWARDR
jgi:hypothetical protein